MSISAWRVQRRAHKIVLVRQGSCLSMMPGLSPAEDTYVLAVKYNTKSDMSTLVHLTPARQEAAKLQHMQHVLHIPAQAQSALLK